MSRPAVFLDRDGVLNRTDLDARGVPHPPMTVEEVELLPGVSEACGLLKRQAFVLVAVTNQPDVVRGTQTKDRIEAINAHLRNLLRLDAVYTCYHDNADACACRKPAPGLILQAAREHDIDLSRSFMVGDRWSDVAAGVSAGCGGGTFLINLPYSQCERCKPDYTVASLLEAARKIVKLAGPG